MTIDKQAIKKIETLQMGDLLVKLLKKYGERKSKTK